MTMEQHLPIVRAPHATAAAGAATSKKRKRAIGNATQVLLSLSANLYLFSLH